MRLENKLTYTAAFSIALVVGLAFLLLLSGNGLISNSFREQTNITTLKSSVPFSYPVSYSTGHDYAPAMISKVVTNQKIQTEIASCSDCTLYPVDKTHSLNPNYVPVLVDTNLAGGGRMTPTAKKFLTDLFTSAKQKGLNPKINSAYRSYSDQLRTFNYWVQKELAKGEGQAQAEINANRYSARPGHSEHQLGTTADVSAVGSDAFSKTNVENKAVWKFLEQEAYKYGFVVSYPPDSEPLTGYVYEPWHIRYIGIELATQIHQLGYYNSKGKLYLAKFLLEL